MTRQTRRTRRQLSLQVLDDRRVLAAIVGSVFNDANDSLRRDLDEGGLAGRLVYVDQNDNSRIDQGERYTLTDADGNFSIDSMVDGDYSVRVYNGTSSQIQTVANSAATLHDVVLRNDVSGGVAAMRLDTASARTAAAILASGNSLQTLAADGALGDHFDLGGTIGNVSRLFDGSLLVLSETAGESRIWLVNETGSAATELNFSGNGLVLTSLANDDVGRGVAVAAGDGSQSELWAIDAVDQSVIATGVMVPEGSVVTGDSTPRTNDGPTRSVISHSESVEDGNGGTTQMLAISFWSHADNSILDAPILVSGASEVVAFQDEAGLLVLRSGDGLTVHDVDGNLATLYSVADTEPVAAIDAARGLMITLSPRSFGTVDSSDPAGIRLLDSETGALVAALAIDLSSLGEIAAVSLDANLSAVLVSGAAGIAQVSLRRPASVRASINGGDSAPVVFGLRLIGDNSAPSFALPPVVSTLEDQVLFSPAPGVATGASDDDGDEYVLLQSGAASSGIATIDLNGQTLYTPIANFEGPVTVPVILHDGRDAVETLVTINVLPVPDPPVSVEVLIDPVPENILPAEPGGDFNAIGVIKIVDVDAVNDFQIQILDAERVPDERFQVINGQIVFVGPGRLDFETEWEIPLIFTVTDPDVGTTIETAVTIVVEDADDPITDIVWSNGVTHKSIRENSPGEIIGSLTAVDEDFEQIHSWSVDDDRFEVVSDELKLKDGVSLDYEAEDTVNIHITATFGEDSFTKAFALTVIDLPEIPVNFGLSNASVLELEPGASVGDLTIAGNPAANGHALTVDDSRFVFDGSTLRLADEVFIERTPGFDDEILIEITAIANAAGGTGVTQPFVITVLANDKPFHNESKPEDVDGDGHVSSLDALIIINFLNTFGPGPVGEGDPAMGYDVNNDGFVTSLDPLLVINELNANSSGGGGTVGNEPGEPSGEEINNPETDEQVVAPQSNLPAMDNSRRVFSTSEEAFAGLLDTLGTLDRAPMNPVFRQTQRIETSVDAVLSDEDSTADATDSTDQALGDDSDWTAGGLETDLLG